MQQSSRSREERSSKRWTGQPHNQGARREAQILKQTPQEKTTPGSISPAPEINQEVKPTPTAPSTKEPELRILFGKILIVIDLMY
jgi:hypothetical protein